MPAPYEINVTESAEGDLHAFTAFARNIILDGIEVHLRHAPTEGSRRIKTLRPNAIATRELRLGDYRVLYDVDEAQSVVTIIVIGEKQGNRLIVRGQEYTEHESD